MLELRTICLLLASTLTLAACKSTEPQPDAAPVVSTGGLVETGEAPSDDNSVELSLEQIIKSSRVENGLRVVDFDLRNSSAEELVFAFRVEWLDRRGDLVADREARWTHLVLPAEASAPLSISAPSPVAESWRLRAAAADKD